MNTILISYRLEQDTDEFQIKDRIKRHPNWARIFNRLCIFKTITGVSSARYEFGYAIQGRGEVFVSNVTDTAWTSFNLDKELSEWFNMNI